MEEHNIPYFRNLWGKSVSDLENQCNVWEEICSHILLSDNVLGEVRTVIGLAKLLINQKLKQFKGLIDDSEFHTGEKEITCTDLEGFWDMVNFEVEKIQKSFDRLSKCKNNGWEFVEEKPKRPVKKVVKKDISAINKKKETTKAHILAARQRIAEARKKMAELKDGNDQNNIQALIPDKEEQIHEKANEIKQEDYVPKRKSSSAKRNDLGEELLNSKNTPKQNNNQRKKLPVSNKENVSMDNNSAAVKHISAKQAESTAQESEKKKRTKSSFIKLQCVTRSASKKALLIQQNVSLK